MLTHEQIMKVRRMEAQYGPGEHCFSPDKHGEAPPSDLPALREGRGEFTLRLRRLFHASGDVTLAPYPFSPEILAAIERGDISEHEPERAPEQPIDPNEPF